MPTLSRLIDSVAHDSQFSGVVSSTAGNSAEFTVEAEAAFGFAHRGYRVPNSLDTRFAIASGTKGLTALAVAGLIRLGILDFNTPARQLLGRDLPLIDDQVTVGQLLAHRSGIGDYFDEEAAGSITDYVLPVPVHQLVGSEDYLRVLDGFPQKFRPDERFSYCNSGYAVLALLAERASRLPFAELLQSLVCRPAGMLRTGFVRSDELPADAAIGYLPLPDVDRGNVFHLPVLGSGDGGLYSTSGDLRRFWSALYSGAIVPAELLGELLQPQSEIPDRGLAYGRGFWLRPETGTVILEGYDAGVSFRSWHDPVARRTVTVLANSSDGAWPMAAAIADFFR